MNEHPDQHDRWTKRLAFLAAVTVAATMLTIVLLFHPGDQRIMAICAVSGIVSVAITTLASRKASADYRRRWIEEQARTVLEQTADGSSSDSPAAKRSALAMKKLDPDVNELLTEKGIYFFAALGTIPAYLVLSLFFPGPALHDIRFGASALTVLGILLVWSRRKTERYRIEWEAEQRPTDPRVHPEEVALRLRRRQLWAIVEVLVIAMIVLKDRRWAIPIGALLILWLVWGVRLEVTRVRMRDDERAREARQGKP